MKIIETIYRTNQYGRQRKFMLYDKKVNLASTDSILACQKISEKYYVCHQNIVHHFKTKYNFKISFGEFLYNKFV